jgi:hypothetical protein
MNLKTITLLLLVLMMNLAEAGAQHSNYSPELWTVIENRWRESQPVVVVYTRSGEVVAGQQIHASSDSLFIYPCDGLPVGALWADDLKAVYINEIDSVLFQKGGNRLVRDKRSHTLEFPSTNARYSEPHVQLRKASVYEDSLIITPDLEMAISHSKVMNQTFRRKRVRYSTGVNYGRDVITNDIKSMLQGTSLPKSYESYGEHTNVEFLDLSVRVMDRLILGGSILTRTSFTNVYTYTYDEGDVYYNLDVSYREHKVYAEYAIVKTDRFFSRKFEVLAGAGLLIGLPEWRFNFSYYNYEDPENIEGGDLYYNYDDILLGAQIKGAFHYYFFPGLSLWTAIDFNLVQPFVISERELNVPDGVSPITIPQHELGFSSVRFKLGLSIYF